MSPIKWYMFYCITWHCQETQTLIQHVPKNMSMIKLNGKTEVQSNEAVTVMMTIIVMSEMKLC